MKLLEIIRTLHTSDSSFQIVTDFGKRIGKTTVSAMDTPGKLLNIVCEYCYFTHSLL